jgi:hypothetical protein
MQYLPSASPEVPPPKEDFEESEELSELPVPPSCCSCLFSTTYPEAGGGIGRSALACDSAGALPERDSKQCQNTLLLMDEGCL